MKTIIFLLAFLSFSSSYSQSVTDYGFADPSIPELSQYEYYRGVWHTTMEMKQEDGSFKELEFTATVTGRFLEDHKTFQSQFTSPSGFFSTDLRTYNTTTKEWQALFLNAKAQRWHEFTSKIIEEKMTTMVLGGYSGKEAFDIKGIDTVISNTHYQRNIYRSYDGMKTWKLIYKMYAEKVE